ncbi:2-oxoacid:ferredoxin oxidoreductase subunit beta [Desulfobulbus oligotrophicus]|uniref:2-oxoacid:ferredoxin oxidoreductase subunit beta n=1 Tax=Desulfobulbus oligotrophicus TaxID=1909699 RepID=A0A7T6APM8_9BACT|nr:2-oxoacid:ferredoxin oxidoreductase subunit beta [Desulfobulbus oligotrophicus]QQG64535.1 2-oxoacid:ferredoxin oxidoreductase subunit beta [Desulfobulbus oligotrophicus]
MTFFRPAFRHPDLPPNAAGFHRRDYEGGLSTLCAGCGHDSICNAIIDACFELALPPHRIAKLSGIGCSSKTPAYFLGRSHGFNSVHGRMPSIATGANMANRDLIYLGVSGDGDTASIGMGQFVHAARRNLNMTYIVMNNGCYGLTKGQFSATADKGSKSKQGNVNLLESIDLCELAIQLGAGFVARSFSGDKAQLVPLIKAGLSHHGLSFIDVISPCVTFNNNPESTKSYHWVREHSEATGTFDFVPFRQTITADYADDTVQEVVLHDSSVIHLHKHPNGPDITDRRQAIDNLEDHKEQGVILTGVLYVNPDSQDTHDILQTSVRPLNSLTEADLCPGAQALEAVNTAHR